MTEPVSRWVIRSKQGHWSCRRQGVWRCSGGVAGRSSVAKRPDSSSQPVTSSLDMCLSSTPYSALRIYLRMCASSSPLVLWHWAQLALSASTSAYIRLLASHPLPHSAKKTPMRTHKNVPTANAQHSSTNAHLIRSIDTPYYPLSAVGLCTA